MTRIDKEALVDQLRGMFSRASVAIVAENRGITVSQSTALRTLIRAVGGEYKVAKHTLTKRAVAGTPYSELAELLEGSRSLVFGYADPIETAKALYSFADQVERFDVAAAAVEGRLIVGEAARQLASMPSVGILRARAVRQILSPGARVLSSVASPGSRIVGAIDSLAKRLAEAGS